MRIKNSAVGLCPTAFLCREKRNASERLVHIMLTGAYAPKKEVFMCFSDKCRPDGIEADIIIEKIVYDRSGPTGPNRAGYIRETIHQLFGKKAKQRLKQPLLLIMQ